MGKLVRSPYQLLQQLSSRTKFMIYRGLCPARVLLQTHISLILLLDVSREKSATAKAICKVISQETQLEIPSILTVKRAINSPKQDRQEPWNDISVIIGIERRAHPKGSGDRDLTH